MKLAIVGTNFISDNLIDAAKETENVEIVAVYSRKRDTGTAFAEKHGIREVYTDYSEMLISSPADAIYVASPTVCHAEHSIAALRAGKHVLCEKMMASDLDGFIRMRDTALAEDRVLLEAMRPAHDIAYTPFRVNLSRIGKIKSAHFEFCQYSSRYDRFKAGILTNAFDPQMMNSSLSDIGIYPLYLALSLFGAPKDLNAESRILHNGFEGEGRLTLHYGCFDVDIVYSKLRNSSTPSYVLGENGRLIIDKISAPTRITYESLSGERELLFDTPHKNNMKYELLAFRRMTEGELDYKKHLAVTELQQRTVDLAYRISGAEKYLGCGNKSIPV